MLVIEYENIWDDNIIGMLKLISMKSYLPHTGKVTLSCSTFYVINNMFSLF